MQHQIHSISYDVSRFPLEAEKQGENDDIIKLFPLMILRVFFKVLSISKNLFLIQQKRISNVHKSSNLNSSKEQ